MSCYASLAQWYDSFTGDVPYDKFIELYEKEFAADGGEFKLLLDLCCGTGTISCSLAKSGYDMIGTDASCEMLNMAYEKAAESGCSCLFLCQSAAELDLYGTVDACVSSLDSINYIPQDELSEAFRRLHLFIRPAGLFIFDIRSEESLRALDGSIFVDESDDALCLWRADYEESSDSICYGMDIFSRCGKLWDRSSEEHTEYAYSLDLLRKMLENAGFGAVKFIMDGPQNDKGRIFVVSKNNS